MGRIGLAVFALRLEQKLGGWLEVVGCAALAMGMGRGAGAGAEALLGMAGNGAWVS